VTCQEIYDQCQDRSDELDYLSLPKMIEAEGKGLLDAGPPEKRTELLIRLLDGWVLEFEARGGPTTELCVVKGGTIVAKDENGADQYPIYPTAYTSVSIAQSVSGTLLVTGGGVGTPDEVSDAVWGADTSGPSGGGSWSDGTFGKLVAKVLTVAKFIGLK
jgi:hypothetical protein